jgi:hypothetical protein
MAKHKEVVETSGGEHTLSFIGLEQSHRLNDDFLFLLLKAWAAALTSLLKTMSMILMQPVRYMARVFITCGVNLWTKYL